MQDQSAYHHQIISAQFPEQGRLKCPRCESTNTKFCYYNNYNLSQPRHYCKNCRRYWTKGGALRNIPVGGGTRKPTKRSSNPKRPKPNPKMDKSLSNGGRNLDRGSTGLGQDPTRISTSEASSAVESKGQDGNGIGELESTALRMKATDHGGNGKDVDPDKNDMSRASDHGFAPVFASMEDMDTDGGVKGGRRDGLGLGVGMARFGGMDTSRGSNMGSGCEELGINYLGLGNGDSGGCWSNGNRWTNLAIYNYTHDNNPRFQ